jgi:tRNA nucleotidyltransferase/poly(A) polymerase
LPTKDICGDVILVRVMVNDQLNNLFQLITACTSRPVWLVGGAVRELLTGHQPVDLDLAIDGSGLAYGAARRLNAIRHRC